MNEIIKNEINSHLVTVNDLLNNNLDQIKTAAKLFISTINNKNKIILFGNGGSAADAQHISAEIIGRYFLERRSLPAIALTTDSSALTAIGNDYGFENIFSRQIEGIANQGDLAVGISTSGNSKNVLKGLEQAKINKCSTLSLTGNSGGKLKNVSDHSIIVDSSNTARIQECHILIGHILCLFIDKNLNI